MWMSGANPLFVQFKTRMTYKDLILIDFDAMGKYVEHSRKDNRTHISIGGIHRGTLVQCRSCRHYFIWGSGSDPKTLACPKCNQKETES